MKLQLAFVAFAGLIAGPIAASSAAPSSSVSGPPYHVAATIPMADGGWDLLSFDADHNRVLVARGAAVSIVDLVSGSAHDIGQLARGHAALAIPGTNEIAVTSGQDNSVRLLDAGNGREIARVAVGGNPDAAIWDAASRVIVVMNAGGGSVSLVDPATAKVVRTIAVKPALELGAMVGPDLLAVNDEDASELELVDLKQGKALAPIPLTGCEGPTGLAYDAGQRITLSACANGVAAVVDIASRKLIQLVPIGQGPDGALFDAKRQLFLVPCGRSGTLTVFSVQGKHVTAAGTVTTELGARTAAIDPVTGRVFLPAVKFQPAQVGQRPAMIPGSTHLLVVAPS